MDGLLQTRLDLSIQRFISLRPALQPLFDTTIAARDSLRGSVGDADRIDDVVFYAELSQIYAGTLMEILADFFGRLARWSGKRGGGALDFGYRVNGVGITRAAWAAWNNHKHWQEWLACQTRGTPFSPDQLRSMKALAIVFFNDENVPLTDDSSAAVLQIYSGGKYQAFEDRVIAALVEIAST